MRLCTVLIALMVALLAGASRADGAAPRSTRCEFRHFHLVTANEQAALLSDGCDGIVEVRDLKTRKVVHLFTNGSEITDVVPRPDVGVESRSLALAGRTVYWTRAGVPVSAIMAAGELLAGCQVTRPNGRTAPGERPSEAVHGEHGLWTALPPDGVLRITRRTPVPEGETFGTIHGDGSLSAKLPWWGSRAAGEKLTIRGTRLDGNARPLRLTIGQGATSNSPHFWASRLRFATPGCWRIKARSGRAHLTFTVAVQRADGQTS